MAQRYLDGVVHFLRRIAGDSGHDALTDRDLLSRFVQDRDGDAFGELVRRHGPMVLAACRRVLNDPADIDDAFQATFVILARRAASVGWQDSIANWLYGAAYRVAVRARSATAVRRRHEDQVHAMSRSEALTETDRQELRALLDEELNRLPAKYRAPLVLCYLEGKTNDEAAQLLGWTKGTVSGRLARARDLLRARLARRNLALPGAAFAAALAESTAPAALSPTLLNATIQAATLPAAGALSASAVPLVEGVLHAMCMTQLKIVLGAVLGVCLLSTGVGWYAYPPGAGASAAPTSPPEAETKTVKDPASDGKVRSTPVRRNGADFVVFADRVWHIPAAGKTQDVDIGLQITNTTGKELTFVVWEAPSVSLQTADGKKLTQEYARDATRMPTPLKVAAGKTITVSRRAKLQWSQDGKELILSGPDNSGGGWSFRGLAAGKYQLNLAYECKEQKEGYWTGDAKPEGVEVELVAEK